MESVKGNTAQMLKRAMEKTNENTNDKLIKRQTTNIQVYIYKYIYRNDRDAENGIFNIVKY